MLLLLLLVVNNNTILLTVLLNAIDSKSSWSLYRVTLLSCSWQLTRDPHGLLLWPVTVDVISCHSSSVTWWWKTKPLDGTVTTLASISLVSASAMLLVNCCWVAAYAEWEVARALRRRASTLFVHQVHLKAHRLWLPIAQSPMRLIVVRSSTPSPTRHFSCSAWAPLKNDSDCWQCNC